MLSARDMGSNRDDVHRLYSVYNFAGNLFRLLPADTAIQELAVHCDHILPLNKGLFKRYGEPLFEEWMYKRILSQRC